MTVYDNIKDTIGNTPLVKLKRVIDDPNVSIFVKLEFFNPLSSVKDRIAASMIEDAESNHLIDSETLIVEPTSGNTGIALAFICARKGYKLCLTMPETMSIERQKLLKHLGAKLILTPGPEGMKGTIKKANKIITETENSFMPDQFSNPANPRIHRQTTAQEILQDTKGNVDILVEGIGTGGTITGVSQVFKEHNPDFKTIAVEPKDSPVLSGGTPGPHKIQGSGAGFIPEILDRSIIDEVFTVSNEEAIDTSRLLAKKEGILSGISSGTVAFSALTVAKRIEAKGKNIIVILPSAGEKYISTDLFK